MENRKSFSARMGHRVGQCLSGVIKTAWYHPFLTNSFVLAAMLRRPIARTIIVDDAHANFSNTKKMGTLLIGAAGIGIVPTAWTSHKLMQTFDISHEPRFGHVESFCRGKDTYDTYGVCTACAE